MPHLPIEMLSHGTIPISDIEHTTKFLKEMFGMEVARTSENSASFRLNGFFCFSCIEALKHKPRRIKPSNIWFHYGFDLPSVEAVDEAYKTVKALAATYNIRKITKPGYGHGTYFFYIVDQDSIYWEVLLNPKDGYRYRFDDIEDDIRPFREQEKKIKWIA